MSLYSHVYDFTVEVITDSAEGDAMPHQLRDAIQRRLARLSDEELVEACGLVDGYSTGTIDGEYEEQPDETDPTVCHKCGLSYQDDEAIRCIACGEVRK